MQLTQAKLKRILHYNPDTGDFTWAVDRRGIRIGQKAGYINNVDCVVIMIDGQNYSGHRLAFFYMTGKWPEHEVDHINGKRPDNRWSNLREATRSQNEMNKGRRSDNKTGFTGVYWKPTRQKFLAQIILNGKRTHLGYHDTAEEAAQVRKLAEDKYFGEFAKINSEQAS